METSFNVVVLPLPLGPSRTRSLSGGNAEGNLVEGASFAHAFPADPIEQGGAMAKELADGLENNTLHAGGASAKLFDYELAQL